MKFLILLSTLSLILSTCAHVPRMVQTPETQEIEFIRSGAIDDIFVLQEYRAEKNSFVESPERHLGQWTGKGYRYTLLDTQGSGSIRHIWTTSGKDGPYFDWEFYIDGEEVPSIRGTEADLIRAAEKVEIRVAPGNTVPLANRDYNLFLPIPFEKSMRIDVVQRQETFWLWFCQIDYRLQDDSLQGARLFSQGEGGDLHLSYVGLPHQVRDRSVSSIERSTLSHQRFSLQPGETRALAELTGPAIVRELRLRWPKDSNLRLLVRYDGAEGYAVNSPVQRFFGPFRGVSFYQHRPNDSSCYLPMPFRESCEILIRNEGGKTARISGEVKYEPVPSFAPSWGYFHALHQRTERTNGHRPHQVMYVRGKGHWLGMSLYETGHDHGGGDFAVIDGEGNRPAFLHGVNGEDYFTFAWFGKGAHHPYAVAHTNEEGRYRHHLENLYPFQESLAIEWGAFADLSPESVSFWYQTAPGDTTLADGAREESVKWDVFGPVPIPHDEQGNSNNDLFAVLPSVADLDAGLEFECKLIDETFTSGWNEDWSVGPMLNLTYIGRHGTQIGGEVELGGMGHAYLARRYIDTPQDRSVECTFAHDDPIQVWLNGKLAYEGGQFFNGFETIHFPLHLREGRNEVVVKLSNYFNRNFNWTGFLLHGEGLR